MATIPSTAYLTLADWATRRENGKMAQIVNLLSQSNPILEDLLWKEGNLPTGNRTTARTGLPSATWRAYNQGVGFSKSSTDQFDDTCGQLEGYSRIDKALADLESDAAAFRLNEDMAYFEGINQQMAAQVFYGNQLYTPQAFTGLAPRFNTINPATKANAVNVLDAGGTGSTNASIWLCCWGQSTGFGIYPKGSQAGLQMKDVTTDAPVSDGQGGYFQAYTTHFKWDCGLTVKDWRYFARIANIDVTQFNTSAAANLISLMIAMVHKIPTMPAAAANVQSATEARGGMPLAYGTPIIYADRTLCTALDLQATNKTNLLLRLEEWNGKPVTTFRGIPIRPTDALLNTEARVV